MDNVSSIAELLAISWTYVSKLLSFVNIRNEGYAIIKRRWGKPVKVYDLSERWCWKWPIAEKFDIVDIRKQVIYLNAHSVKNDDGSKNIIPFNTTIRMSSIKFPTISSKPKTIIRPLKATLTIPFISSFPESFVKMACPA